jgi:putative transposase
MQFQEGHLYHIYNQGNNKRKIFFSERNYRFFMQKIKTHLLPYADVLAWCLMPNHFHLMAYVNTVTISEDFTNSEVITSAPASGGKIKIRTINDSIGILLRSYTRAINKQENTTGSLFRKETKAKCISCQEGVTPNFSNTNFGTSINFTIPENQYPQICFEYIHKNPVNAGLVNKETDWLFSSASAYIKNKKDELVNKEVANQFVNW